MSTLNHALRLRSSVLLTAAVVGLLAASPVTANRPAGRSGPPGESKPNALIHAGGTLFFTARDAAHGRELWKSDGTADGTRRVKDIWPGSGTSDIARRNLVEVGGTLYFSASDGVHGSDLWKSDGTHAGTTRVLPVSGEGLDPKQLTNVDGTLYFIANRRELWKSDGTPEGTEFIETLPRLDIYTSQLTAVGSRLFFVVPSHVSGDGHVALWKSDGTPNSTRPVEVVSDASWVFPVGLTSAGGLLYFTFRNGIPDAPPTGVLWRSDGTAAGTRQMFDVDVDGYDDGIGPMAEFDGKLFFGAHGGDRDGLWKTTGTHASTKRINGVTPWGPLVDVDGTLFYQRGNKLWTSDGTAAGTQVVDQIGTQCCADALWVGLDGVLYFPGESGSGDVEPWRSDGTAAGTHRLANLAPSGSSEPSDMAVSNGSLFLVADDGIHGSELWMSDGTAAGTVLVEDIVP